MLAHINASATVGPAQYVPQIGLTPSQLNRALARSVTKTNQIFFQELASNSFSLHETRSLRWAGGLTLKEN